MNEFGGDWTEQKIVILEKYAQAFLKVFKDKPYIKLLYFDGFAGSGDIKSRSGELIEGAALRILKIDNPRPFDLYYFVEYNEGYKNALEGAIQEKFPNRNYYVVAEDCNIKIQDMVTKFLGTEKGKNYKVLAFIDPKGMQVNWKSIEMLKDHSVDLWILSPTGGANRLLKKDGKISKAWLDRLNKFMGLSEEEVKAYFYKNSDQMDIWGNTETLVKQKDAVNRLHELYVNQLKSVFKYTTAPFVMRNSTNSIMFHFFMATNNPIAKKIADSVIKPKFEL
ncbi:three-Cys-motif partner protein TcmP [Roseivirga sp. BDSF3-8]|uniref:three-Cys-motif partner protein TcmP n=1 Tax=Roseivirga sp. BDSF3-8 TaxID=3241598 RepID=UPI0035327B01